MHVPRWLSRRRLSSKGVLLLVNYLLHFTPNQLPFSRLECPTNSTCRSLSDGHECITNATFDGTSTSLTYKAMLAEPSDLSNSFTASFRSQTGGPIISMAGTGGEMRLSLVQGRVEMLLPEGGEEGNFTFGTGLDDGQWHTVEIWPSNEGQIKGRVMSGNVSLEFDEYLEDNSTIRSLSEFVPSALVVLGSNGPQSSDFFRGCMREVRVGGILLPFFSEAELMNSTAGQKFVVEQRPDNLTKGDCELCYQSQCQNAGVCSDPSEQFDCTCPPGFTGSLCEINIDECETLTVENMCKNGVCKDGQNNYTCTCESGWVGWLCDQDLDECETSPCQHEGVCTQTAQPGDYYCTCPEKYKGKDCQELKVKTCNETPCENGGTCIPENGDKKYRCDCPQGYEGDNCDRQTDWCQHFSVQCQNGGTCLSVVSSFNFKCECPPGFEGVKCETETNECAAQPCKNGGLCQDKLNHYRCDCDNTGFRGSTCEENINECLESPCQNGGRCNDTLGTYSCLCNGSARGFCGRNCHVPDPCANVRYLKKLLYFLSVCCRHRYVPMKACACLAVITRPPSSAPVGRAGRAPLATLRWVLNMLE